MGNSKNKRYRGNFTDLLYSTKYDDRAARFEVYFSVDRKKLCYKNSDSEVIELEQLLEEQLSAIQNSNNPSSNNPFATMEDVIIAGGLQSVVAGTDISVDSTDPLNPVISSDFNGIPLSGTEDGSPVTGDIYIFGDGDERFILNGNNPSDAKNGIWFTDDGLVGFKSININNETTTIINRNSEISIESNNPSFKGLIGSQYYGLNYDDNTYVQKLYVDRTFIPLTGTLTNAPVIGTVEFDLDVSKTALSTTDNQLIVGAGNDINIDENATRKALLDVSSTSNEQNSAKITAQDSTNGLLAMVEVKTDTSQSSTYQQFININVGGESAGLGAANDHTPFIGDLDYVQKKYVDDLLKTTMLQVDYGDILAVATGSQIFTTGLGTGTASVDLLPTIQVGDLIFVSDLANDASTHNIQIDAGVGSTILKGDGTPASQTFTIDSSGQSYTLRKMTSTQYMIIGTNQ